MRTRIATILFNHHLTVQTTTGRAPSELMLGHRQCLTTISSGSQTPWNGWKGNRPSKCKSIMHMPVQETLNQASECMSEIINLENLGYLVKCRKGRDLFCFELRCRIADFVDVM